MEKSFSLSKTSGGTGHNRKHNLRIGKLGKHIDPERVHLNEVLLDEPLGDVYHELFDAAVEEYNAGQKRRDRRIDDYFEKVRKDKKTQECVECVAQIGRRETNSAEVADDRELSALVYRAFLPRFIARYPNMRVFHAVIHNDEATPHLHIAMVPWADDWGTTGPRRKVTREGAVAAMGLPSTLPARENGEPAAPCMADACADARLLLHEVGREFGIENVEMGIHRQHLDVAQFKHIAAELEEGLSPAQKEAFAALYEFGIQGAEAAESYRAKLENLASVVEAACEPLLVNKRDLASAVAAARLLSPPERVWIAGRQAIGEIKAALGAQVERLKALWWPSKGEHRQDLEAPEPPAGRTLADSVRYGREKVDDAADGKMGTYQPTPDLPPRR